MRERERRNAETESVEAVRIFLTIPKSLEKVKRFEPRGAPACRAPRPKAESRLAAEGGFAWPTRVMLLMVDDVAADAILRHPLELHLFIILVSVSESMDWRKTCAHTHTQREKYLLLFWLVVIVVDVDL